MHTKSFPQSGDDVAENHPQMITISVPLNITVVGGLITRWELPIPLDPIFVDFFSGICANMDANSEEDLIGYVQALQWYRAGDPPR